MRLPAVVGVKGILSEVKDGEVVVMDGETGELYLNPTEDLVKDYIKKPRRIEKRKRGIEKINS